MQPFLAYAAYSALGTGIAVLTAGNTLPQGMEDDLLQIYHGNAYISRPALSFCSGAQRLCEELVSIWVLPLCACGFGFLYMQVHKDPFTITPTGGPAATVTFTDFIACSAIEHVLDTVLLPQSV